MNKEQWLQITTKVYQEYGFVKKGRFFYLDLEDVLICSKLAQIYGVDYLAYNFSVKAVHSPKERKSTNMYDGYDGMENIIYFDPNAWGINKRAIWYEKWTEKYYTAKLKELLHYYFDPYKQDALGHIKRCYFEIGLVHKDEIIEVSGLSRFWCIVKNYQKLRPTNNTTNNILDAVDDALECFKSGTLIVLLRGFIIGMAHQSSLVFVASWRVLQEVCKCMPA